MPKQSQIFNIINDAVTNCILKEPFNVNDVNNSCNDVLAKSPAFLSKHRKGNPGGYKAYFERETLGKYVLLR